MHFIFIDLHDHLLMLLKNVSKSLNFKGNLMRIHLIQQTSQFSYFLVFGIFDDGGRDVDGGPDWGPLPDTARSPTGTW